MFEHLFQELDHEEILGLTDEAKALYLYNYFLHKKKSIVVVTSSLYEANKLYQSLSNYTDEAYFFPMDDFLTSEALAISPELEYNRLDTIHKIFENREEAYYFNVFNGKINGDFSKQRIFISIGNNQKMTMFGDLKIAYRKKKMHISLK